VLLVAINVLNLNKVYNTRIEGSSLTSNDLSSTTSARDYGLPILRSAFRAISEPIVRGSLRLEAYATGRISYTDSTSIVNVYLTIKLDKVYKETLVSLVDLISSI